MEPFQPAPPQATPSSLETLQVFPTLIHVYDLEPVRAEPLNQAIGALVDKLFDPPPNTMPGQNLSTHHDLHRYPEMAPLLEVYAAGIEQTIAKLKVQHEGWAITGCWANVNRPGVSHVAHNHPNNWLAAVYYVRAPDGGNAITFHEPRQQSFPIRPIVARHAAVNASAHPVPVKPGRLVVFPAWLYHSVPANQGRSDRMSVAFNMMLLDAERVLPPLAWRD
ncbi:MAG: 2OG-Fe(II) oxygenase family protein [Pseudomonadota bacterium]